VGQSRTRPRGLRGTLLNDPLKQSWSDLQQSLPGQTDRPWSIHDGLRLKWRKTHRNILLVRELNNAEYQFEELCCELLLNEPEIRTCDPYGARGETHHGIDLEAYPKTGNGIEVAQCKCYGDFAPGDIRSASDAFLAHWKNIWSKRRVKRFVLLVACDMDTAAVRFRK